MRFRAARALASRPVPRSTIDAGSGTSAPAGSDEIVPPRNAAENPTGPRFSLNTSPGFVPSGTSPRLSADVNVLHQHPLTAHRIQHLEQQGPQQMLGRNRRPACLGIQRVEPRRQPLQGLIRHRADGPQRVVRRNALLRRQVTQHFGEELSLVLPSNQDLHRRRLV